jgi:lysophospholipase L1-like esterase
LLTGCDITSATEAPATPKGGWSLVALGDSVPSGYACDCTPYPQLSASQLSPHKRPPVTASNDAVAGYTSADVLHQLGDASQVITDVQGASVVAVEIGANDVSHSSSCGNEPACYLPKVPEIEANLRAIVLRLHQLAARHHVDVVLLDYWNVWLGGKYAREQGQAYVDAADAVTDRVNTAIRDVAAQTGSGYVDVRAAFKGPDYRYDETHFLAPDGDHPNAAGHREIAKALTAVVQKHLQLT